MATAIQFDLLTFRPLKDPRAWQARYQGQVRCSVEWSAMKNRGKVGLVVADPKRTQLWYPWYTRGSWRAGEPRCAKWKGTGHALVRIPAVCLSGPGEKYLLLDGNHRILELDPCFVMLDVYYPTKDTWWVFTDLLNKNYREWRKR